MLSIAAQLFASHVASSTLFIIAKIDLGIDLSSAINLAID